VISQRAIVIATAYKYYSIVISSRPIINSRFMFR